MVAETPNFVDGLVLGSELSGEVDKTTDSVVGKVLEAKVEDGLWEVPKVLVGLMPLTKVGVGLKPVLEVEMGSAPF